MTEKTELFSVDKLRVNEGVITSSDKIIEYKYWYPDKDKNSIHRTLRIEFGYFMVFKSVGWRTKDFLKKRIRELQKDDELVRDHGGFKVKIKIIDVK